MIHWVFARVYKKIELFKVRLTVRRDTLVSRFDCQVCFYKETRLWGVDQTAVSKSLVFNARLADQEVGGEWKLLQTIIIAFKGANRDFLTISSLRLEPSPTRTLKWPGRNCVQNTCNTSSAYHVQYVVLYATCLVIRRDSSAITFNRVEIAFIWDLFYWLNH